MSDLVNHPPHYVTAAGVEAIDVMEQYGLGLHLGSAMKYLLRAGRKDDERTDLCKAVWYLNRWLGGISEAHGIEYPTASDDAVCWYSPDDIADAFALVGARRDAVLHILNAAAFESDFDAVVAMVLAAITAITGEIKP